MLKPLSASDLLELWERGAGRLPAEQGFLLLRAASPDVAAADLLRLPIGQRDALLMRLRQKTFGSSLNGLAICPNCGEQVEIGFLLEDLFAGHPQYPETPTLAAETTPEPFKVSGYDLAFRLPNSADLMNLPSDPQAGRLALLETCVIHATRNGEPVQASELPELVVQALSERMEAADPLANLSLPLTCPACGHQWELVFDIVSFLWSEVSGWAQRLLREVHALASAYGWRETDILTMSAWRRHKYLELVGA